MSEFSLDEKGIWYHPAPNKEGEQPVPIWVCSPLEVIAVTRDHNNENFGRLLQFSDSDGITHKWPMPMELLAGDGTAYRQVLLSKGLQIKEGRQGQFWFGWQLTARSDIFTKMMWGAHKCKKGDYPQDHKNRGCDFLKGGVLLQGDKNLDRAQKRQKY